MIPNIRHLTIATACAAALLAPGATQGATIPVSGYLTGTQNWYATNTYLLTGFTYVMAGAVLNIEAGTVVKGVPGTDNKTFGTLFITQGGKLNAQGTANKPIIFTAEADDVNDPFDEVSTGYQRGLWGGIVLLGNARLNNSVSGSTNAPMYDVYEGLADTQVNGQFIHRFGGTDDNDNSGVLRYVSVRHGGKKLESNKEINGVSFGAVGRGTTVDYVEAFCVADDGFEWFGGAVNTKHLVSAFNDDDCFDTDQGYNGTNQFWFSIQEPGVRDEGFELNGQPTTTPVQIPLLPGSQPVANWVVYNATLIGAGAGGVATGNDAMNIRQLNECRIYNSIFTDFDGEDIRIDGSSTASRVRGNLFFNTGSAGTGSGWAQEGSFNLVTDPMLRGINRAQVNGLDPRPMVGSPAWNPNPSHLPTAGAVLESVDYAGAFGCENWMRCWTALDADLYLGSLYNRAANVVNVSGYLTGTQNWYATNTYLLNGFTYVMAGAVLNIEAGTVVKGVPGTDNKTFGTLFVTQGGKLNAQGTRCNPIIFTAEADDVNDPFDNVSTGYQRGLWGGLVLLGNARLNNSVSGSTNAPMYDVYEGLADTQVNGQFIHRFGGTDDNDNSGVLRYVSVRHGGKKLESNKEINGVSFGAVGRGTTVDYVEAFCVADDGFEWFGGAVNTKHLVSAFNDDDCFDTDQGYNGTNQFWFSIQEPGVRDEGFELNGQPTTTPVQIPLLPGSQPVANWVVYNATLIGAGAGGVATGNDAMNIRQLNECRIYNSIFTDFDGEDIRIDGSSTASRVRGNLFFNTGSAGTGSGWAQEGAFNLVTDPMLRGISRAQEAALNPLLLDLSPAWTANPAYTAPADGFLQAATYAGAFSDSNWALDWTALGGGAYFKYVCPPAAAPAPQCPEPTLTIALVGGNVVISWPSSATCSYQVKSKTILSSGSWTNEGAAMAGTGGVMTKTVPASSGAQFFRVAVQ